MLVLVVIWRHSIVGRQNTGSCDHRGIEGVAPHASCLVMGENG
jgi:hypothetical protein